MSIEKMSVKDFIKKIIEGEQIVNAYYKYQYNYYNIDKIELYIEDNTIYLAESGRDGVEFEENENVYIIDDEE